MVSLVAPLEKVRSFFFHPTVPANEPHEADQPHMHPESDMHDVITWFAYRDEDDTIARAVCAQLSFVVERPTVQEAADEIRTLITDCVDDATARGETSEQFLRLLPREMQSMHMARFMKMLELHLDEKGAAWLGGHCHISRAKVPAQAT